MVLDTKPDDEFHGAGESASTARDLRTLVLKSLFNKVIVRVTFGTTTLQVKINNRVQNVVYMVRGCKELRSLISSGPPGSTI